MFERFLEPTAAVPLIAALIALFGHFWNPWSARKLEKQKAQFTESLERQKAEYVGDIEQLKARLNTEAAVRDARLDYEYEARKRLYEFIEPLLFQLYEAVERANGSLRGIARDSQRGRLPPGAGNWLSDKFYLNSTVYRLLLPIAILRIIQKRMTFVDFDLDGSIRTKYELLRMYARSFTQDIELAASDPSLTYDPYHPEASTLLEREPAIYAGQGLVASDLDNAADALLVTEGERLRSMSFGEFGALLEKGGQDKNGFAEIFELYGGFSPNSSPVLARIMMVQGCLTKVLLEVYRSGPAPDLIELSEAVLRSDDFRKNQAWIEGTNLADKDAAIVRRYIADQLDRRPLLARRPGPR